MGTGQERSVWEKLKVMLHEFVLSEEKENGGKQISDDKRERKRKRRWRRKTNVKVGNCWVSAGKKDKRRKKRRKTLAKSFLKLNFNYINKHFQHVLHKIMKMLSVNMRERKKMEMDGDESQLSFLSLRQRNHDEYASTSTAIRK